MKLWWCEKGYPLPFGQSHRLVGREGGRAPPGVDFPQVSLVLIILASKSHLWDMDLWIIHSWWNSLFLPPSSLPPSVGAWYPFFTGSMSVVQPSTPHCFSYREAKVTCELLSLLPPSLLRPSLPPSFLSGRGYPFSHHQSFISAVQASTPYCFLSNRAFLKLNTP